MRSILTRDPNILLVGLALAEDSALCVFATDGQDPLQYLIPARPPDKSSAQDNSD